MYEFADGGMIEDMLGLTTIDNAKDLTDEEVLKRSQKEPWIYAVLLDRYQAAFLRKARSIVHNELDAEEVVQDAFTKISYSYEYCIYSIPKKSERRTAICQYRPRV